MKRCGELNSKITAMAGSSGASRVDSRGVGSHIAMLGRQGFYRSLSWVGSSQALVWEFQRVYFVRV